MKVEQIINQAVNEGVFLYLKDGQLAFKAKKGAFSAELKSQVKANKPAIVDYLAQLSHQDSISHTGVPELTKAQDLNTIPMSFAQQRMWFIEQFEQGSAIYNMPKAYGISGSFNQAAFEFALRAIIERHSMLRTRFVQLDENIYQRVSDDFELPLQCHDVSGQDEGQRQASIDAILAQDAQQPFDLQQDILLRVTLILTGVQQWVVQFNMHHIASDATSMALFMSEFGHLYSSQCNDQTSQLTPLTFQYADYAKWQRDWLRDEVLEEQLAYWQGQLAQLPPVHDLPLDKPRPVKQQFNGDKVSLVIDEALTAQIRHLCKQNDVTLFMMLQSVFSLLISLYSNEKDIVMGTPVSGRIHSALESVVGCFLNVLVLRNLVSRDSDFVGLLGQHKQVMMDAFNHQHLPFETLVESLNPERNLSYNPIFQIMFTLQDNRQGETKTLGQNDVVSLKGIELTPIKQQNESTKFDLDLNIAQFDHRLSASWTYNSDLFDHYSIKRLAEHYVQLLHIVLAQPTTPLNQLDLLGDEQRQLLDGFNDTAMSVDDLTVAQRFEQAAQTHGEKVALVDGSTSLSYQVLNEQANQLAALLAAKGCKKGELVIICLERSINMMVAVLAVLKTGAAYVPVDAAYPKARIEVIVEGADALLAISSKSLLGKLSRTPCEILSLDESLMQQLATQVVDNPVLSNVNTSEDLAYVMFTSGSTGKPKGVMVTHANLGNIFTDMSKRLAPENGTWLAVTSLSFDISVLELLFPLSEGMKVVIGKDPRKNSLDQLKHQHQSVDFSLFYFSSDEGERSQDKYKLLLEGAKFGDSNGFEAVWTPERHFATFGGLYPNPAITGSAVAAITDNIKIRAGSCVLPLHNPVRMVEDWSVIDNISNGRVGLAFASGWQPDDFALAPDNFNNRHQILFDSIKTAQSLWRGNTVTRTNGVGKTIEVSTLPRPIQPELPTWVTAAGSPETFRKAGEAGYNLLTHLLGQTVEELSEKITIYREARKQAGFDGSGCVTLMLHTFVNDDEQHVHELVEAPFKKYLGESVALISSMAQTMGLSLDNISAQDHEAVLDHAYQRYFNNAALFGTPEHCATLVDKVKGIGVDEIACMIDFGVDSDEVLASLPALKALKDITDGTQTVQREQALTIDELINRHQVTHLQSTPSLVSTMLEETAGQQALASLQQLLVGGEKFPLNLAQILKQTTSANISNMYGPTETTIWSACYALGETGNSVPIGTGLANTQVYIVDEHLNQVPVGACGEICIAGAGVSKGYIGNDELTQKVFVPNPFDKDGQSPLYRTGDLGRWHHNGILECFGRLDEQVKLRGFRIELGEIEFQLTECDEVAGAVVVLREDQPGEKRLVAYIVLTQALAVDEYQIGVDLRQKLNRHLTHYMIPSAFVVMEQLPLTPNGKVDKKALPAPDMTAAQGKYVPPETENEQALVELWSKLLKLDEDKISVTANFFELGGHSLLAVRLVAAVSRFMQARIDIRQVFTHSTIRLMADIISQQQSQAALAASIDELEESELEEISI